MGTIVFAVMQCLGEMVSHLPVSGGHITLARRFVGEDMVRLSSAVGLIFANDQSRLSPLAGNTGIVSEKSELARNRLTLSQDWTIVLRRSRRFGTFFF